MHVVYLTYVLVCAMQTALFLFTIAQDWHIQTIDMVELDPPILFPFGIVPQNNSITSNKSDIIHKNKSNNDWSSTIFNAEKGFKHITILVPKQSNLDRELGICSLLAVLYSILYIYIGNLDNNHPFLEKTADDECLQQLYDPLAARSLLFIRNIFWIFCFIQYKIIFSALNLYTTFEIKYLYVLAKLIIIWFLCRTGRKKKIEKWALTLLLAQYAYLLWIFSGHFRHSSFLILTVEAILDAVLILGHYWDSQAPMITIINCRLFYVAATSTLVQLLVFSTPNH